MTELPKPGSDGPHFELTDEARDRIRKLFSHEANPPTLSIPEFHRSTDKPTPQRETVALESWEKQIPQSLDGLHISDAHKQMAVVIGNGWNDPNGMMRLYERRDGHWQPTNQSWPVDVGMKGIAWGSGLIENSKDLGAQKHEGDNRAPAGLFELGTAFGASAFAPTGSRMPWRQVHSNDFFVDDPRSPQYNTWVSLRPGQSPNWSSAENMKRRDNLYDLGVVVNHNMNPVRAGAGSAIFMHVWRGPGSGTEGCTAMSEANMRAFLTWLDPQAKPLLLQVPRAAVGDLARAHVDPYR